MCWSNNIERILYLPSGVAAWKMLVEPSKVKMKPYSVSEGDACTLKILAVDGEGRD